MTRWIACALALATWLAAAVPPLIDVISDDVARFTASLTSAIPERRVEGIQGLSQLKHWPAEEELLRHLDDPSEAVRHEALLAICRIGTAKSVPRLIQLLAEPSWDVRENAKLALERMTAHSEFHAQREWQNWWSGSSLAQKQQELLATATKGRTNATPANETDTIVARGRRVPRKRASVTPSAYPARREALRALRHLADASVEPRLIALLRDAQAPALDLDERTLICEALERVGTTNAIAVLAAQRIDAAAWALGRIGGADAERALRSFPPTLAMFLSLDRLHSTNGAPWIPMLVSQMGQITYRSQPDDVMNDELQPIQRVGASLIRRSGFAPQLIECALQELEDTMKPATPHGPRPIVPAEWNPMLKAMRSELKPGFVREDGTTTSQPIVAMCYLVDDRKIAPRLIPLLRHPAIVPRVYVALALGRLHATEALPEITKIIDEGYSFSDSTALASGKHFDQSQTVRWRGFLCMALGRMGGDEARLALERRASDANQPRDIRFSSVVGLRFIASPKSLRALREVAERDLIWMVRDEARRTAEYIEVDNGIASGVASNTEQK